MLFVSLLLAGQASAQQWVASWTASVHGPYPVGNPTAQPELKYAFASAEKGARNQSFHLIVRPDVWGPQTRIRLSNAFGTQPVTFNDAYVGLQESGSAILKGTNQPVLFAGQKSVTVAPGQNVVSDAVALPFVKSPPDPLLKGRKLAVSFHVVGESGPMTWHAKALQTSYIAPAGAGPHSQDEGESAFPFSTTSWYFLDEVDMNLATKANVIVAFGDSITDGTASTIVSHGRSEVDAKRKALNEFFRTSKIFDGVIDFDKATLDPATGEVKPEYQPNSSTGGPGDKLHPNRAGYAAMANAIDLAPITGRAK